MAGKGDSLATVLRKAYTQYTDADYQTINKKHFKDTNSFEGNREKYAKAVNDARQSDPMGFQELQDMNTDAKIRALNAIDMDRDAYARDPVSKKAFKDLQYKLSVPFGYSDREGKEYALPGNALGATITNPKHPEAGSVTIASGIANPEMQNGRLGLQGVLRHEGEHSIAPNRSHPRIYALDRMYQMANKGNDRALGRPYREPPTPSRMTSLMLDAKNAVRAEPELGNPDMIPKGLNEQATWGEVATLPAEEQLKALESAREYEIRGTGVMRDLPDKGWWDEMWSSKKD